MENQTETKQTSRGEGEKVGNVASLRSQIHLLTIIGEIEGYESLGERSKTTKYENVLPRLAQVEDDPQIEGLLVLLNTVGGACGGGTCHCGNDRIPEQTYSLSCSGRRTFHRCAWQSLPIILLLYPALLW